MRTEPWTPPHEGNERFFEKTWDAFAWGVIAISIMCEEFPKTYDDIRNMLDTTFREKFGENLHTYLSQVVSMEPDQRPEDVKQLQKEILKLTDERRSALGLS